MRRLVKLVFFIALVYFVALGSNQVAAQCPMCQMTAESNLRDGGDQAKGLNKGIIYLLATPYVLMGMLGYMWWRNKKAQEVDDQPEG